MAEEIEARVTAWASKPSGAANGFLGGTGVAMKVGQRVLRAVKLARFGDGSTGEVKTRQLVFEKHEKRDGHFSLAKPDDKFTVYDGEIDVLRDFLNAHCAEGEFLLVRADEVTRKLLDLAKDDDRAAEALLSALTDNLSPSTIAAALQATSEGVTSAELAVLGDRRAFIDRARVLAADPASRETEMQRLLKDAHWVFGGQYVGVFQRRNLLPLDEHDIPLVRADGSLHIVELKGPNIPKLVREHRSHHIVGPEVHEAVMQAANYIRSADELGLAVSQNLTYSGVPVDLRRVFATVVIGHRSHVEHPSMAIDQALRTYNASLSRIEVVTYDQVLDAASRTLDFTGREAQPGPVQPPTPDDVPF